VTRSTGEHDVNIQRRTSRRGATILELAVVMIIIVILASMLLPLYSGYQTRVEEARCIENLKNLYIAASGHLQANKSWPQIPTKLIAEDPKIYAKSWVEALRPYGAPHSSWLCPTLQRSLRLSLEAVEKDENYRIDYVGTPFDDNEASPRRSERAPWFIEKTGFHARGNLVILSTGSITSIRDIVMQERIK
jgi:type II secretory pathway pseudopilin PulG